MSQPVLTLELPEDLYEHVCRAAKGMKQPVETALVNIVKAATPSLDQVPAEYRAELEAMEDLGDAELWKEAESSASPTDERRVAKLLAKNQHGELSQKERETLIGLRTAADRRMLRRSYAYVLLKYRGHRIPNPPDVRP